jgi:hypothetical protein
LAVPVLGPLPAWAFYRGRGFWLGWQDRRFAARDNLYALRHDLLIDPSDIRIFGTAEVACAKRIEQKIGQCEQKNKEFHRLNPPLANASGIR